MKHFYACPPAGAGIGTTAPMDLLKLTKLVSDSQSETLGEWIRFSGLIPMKIKLNGDDLAWGLGSRAHR
jgi:hypothetical protein